MDWRRSAMVAAGLQLALTISFSVGVLRVSIGRHGSSDPASQITKVSFSADDQKLN